MTRRMARYALLTALAMVLSWLEAMVPASAAAPGMKLGLANLAVVMALYLYGWREALMVNVLRIMLTGLLFGNMFSVLFSLSGALVSFICMLSARKLGLSLYGVSMAGGVSHNAGQLLTAAYVVHTVEIGYYAPFLLAAGLVTGFLIGVLGKEMLRRIPEG